MNGLDKEALIAYLRHCLIEFKSSPSIKVEKRYLLINGQKVLIKAFGNSKQIEMDKKTVNRCIMEHARLLVICGYFENKRYIRFFPVEELEDLTFDKEEFVVVNRKDYRWKTFLAG